MINRELTGNYYLKRYLFGYKVYVEIIYNIEEPYDLSISPDIKTYVKAKREDLLKLKINVI
jgi:hypothetical protein